MTPKGNTEGKLFCPLCGEVLKAGHFEKCSRRARFLEPKDLDGSKTLGRNKKIKEKIRQAVGDIGELRAAITLAARERRAKEKKVMDSWRLRQTKGLIKPEERRSNFMGPRKEVVFPLSVRKKKS